tara:strand:- start:1224 stop:1463 length:240 start_codon:yes stop_codon:yes gene_type:complete
MPNSLKTLILLLTVSLLYSCQKPLQAQENYLDKSAYVQVVHVAHHTKHIRKQQRKIHDRLRKIRERIEKKKKRKFKGGK